MVLKIDLTQRNGDTLHYEQPRVPFGQMSQLMKFESKQEKRELRKKFLDKKLAAGTASEKEFNERLALADEEAGVVDEMIDVVVNLFNNPKVTSKTINEGLNLSDGADKLSKILSDAMGGTHSAADSAAKK